MDLGISVSFRLHNTHNFRFKVWTRASRYTFALQCVLALADMHSKWILRGNNTHIYTYAHPRIYTHNFFTLSHTRTACSQQGNLYPHTYKAITLLLICTYTHSLACNLCAQYNICITYHMIILCSVLGRFPDCTARY